MTYQPPIQDYASFEAEALHAMGRPIAEAKGAFHSRFGAIPWAKRHEKRTDTHRWLIKNVLTAGEMALLVGPSQSGKSFVAIDIAMSVARGVPFLGHKVVEPGLVIYHAGESAKGVRDLRLPAYEIDKGLQDDAVIPFVLLTKPLDLYGSDDDVNSLIAEAKHWQAEYGQPVRLLVIDTFSAATPGADENASRDVSGIRRRTKRLEAELGCTVMIVHHKNADGTKPRGHTSIFADIECALDVKIIEGMHDANKRKIREIVMSKLKDGEAGKSYRFVLRAVEIGVDEDFDPITSCVIEPPTARDGQAQERDPAVQLSPQAREYYRAVVQAVRQFGEPAPQGVPCPGDVQAVRIERVYDAFEAAWFGEEPGDERAEAIRQARTRQGRALAIKGLIGKHKDWVWLTKKGQPKEQPAPAIEKPAEEWRKDDDDQPF